MKLFSYAFGICVTLWLINQLALCSGEVSVCPSSGTQILNSASGEIASHSGVGVTNHLNNMRCYWQIRAPRGYVIFVHFAYINLESCCDKVTLYDGSSSSSRIAAVTGTSTSSLTSYMYVSTSNLMTVYFYTDGSVVRRGFRLLYTRSGNESRNMSSCGSINFTSPSNTSGVFSSHGGYGITLYAPNMSCLWTLPELSGHYINMTVAAMSLGSGDCLRLSSNSALIISPNTSYCGPRSASGLLRQMAGHVQIEFNSNDYSQSIGFQIYFRYEPYCLGFKNLTAEDGEILSHRRVGSRSYLNNLRCYWQIRAPRGHRVAAWFSYIDLHGSDRVTLHDGANGSAVIASVSRYYSSSYVSPRYVSTSNIMTVYFYTSSSYTRNGFRLRYSVANDSRSSTCGRIEFTDASHGSGLISSHDSYGSAPYPSNLSCSWTLPELTGRYIHLSMTNLSLGAGDCLRIDGNSTSGVTKISRNYCGWTAVSGISLLMGGDVQIVFSSNSRHESSGFLVSFRYETVCSGVKYLTHESGEIVSHSRVGTSPYPHSAQCTWMIIAPPGKQILAWFTYINLRSHSDAINLYDGNSDSRRLLTTSGSSGSSYVSRLFSSSLNFMTVRFNTGSSPTALGFRLQYSTRDEFCHGRRSLTAQSGEIASHQGVNSTNYLKNMNCYWEITAPPGENVLARFTYIRLGPYGDRVSLYDGTTLNSLGTIRGDHSSGHYFERMYSSVFNVMRVEFHTGSYQPSLGFRLQYSTTEEHCTGLKLLTTKNGDLSSHSAVGRQKFLGGLICRWRIVVPAGNRVLSEFTYMTLSHSDSITLYDGITGSLVLARVTGSSASSHISSKLLSSSNVMTVEFRTGSSSNSLGFTLKYDGTDSFCQGYRMVPAGSGEIASHSDAGVTHYVNNMRCYWQIRGHPGSQIYASIYYRSLESYTDTVTLIDGVSGITVATVRGGYGAGYLPPQFRTSSNVLIVLFSTDSSGTSLGFRLKYRSSGDRLSTTTYVSESAITSSETNSTDSGDFGEQDGPRETPVLVIAFSVAGPAMLIGLAALIAVLLYKRLRVPPSDGSKDQNGQHEKADSAIRAASAAHDYVFANVAIAGQNKVEDDEEGPYDLVKDVDLQA